MGFLTEFPNAGNGILDVVASLLPINIGVPQDIAKAQYNKYVVTINAQYGSSGVVNGSTTSRQPVNIMAFLQEKISMQISSDWKSAGFQPPEGANAVSQVAWGRSLVSTVASRRIWAGSTPLEMSLLLRFEAYSNILNEVIQPIARLQGMVCAREGGLGGNFLIPPGPNPFKFTLGNVSSALGNQTFLGTGDVISINIGQFLTFPSVIISSVAVDWDPRMGDQGPVGANATVTFSTYEMVTQEKLVAMYNKAVTLTGIAGAEIPATPNQPSVATASMAGSVAGPIGAFSEVGRAIGQSIFGTPTATTPTVP